VQFVGFGARPIGAAIFGHYGDRIGRKATLVTTLMVMGIATFLMGLLPSHATWGVAAPVLLVILRILQGIGVGGEWGGSVLLSMEWGVQRRRGFFASWPQLGVPLGLLLSTGVVKLVQGNTSEDAFNSWGWRIPFLLSIFLVAISLFIRLRLRESPLFAAMKSAGHTSKAPITESFGSAAKWQTILTVLWGAAAGQAVVWYTGQFYALSWLQGKSTGNVPFVDSNWIIAAALALGTPFFIVFGALSDRIGRKPVMMAGNLLGAVLTIPIFWLMYRFTPNGGNYQPIILALCVFVLVIFVTIVYGPIAAFLVESFPSRVRYTSVSLPYHIGNGYFGGFLPFIATAVVTNAQKSGTWQGVAQYAGLVYPVTVAAITFVLGIVLLRETKTNQIAAETYEPAERYPGQPAILVLLVALTAVALVVADQFLMPNVSPNPTTAAQVQWGFRILALAILAISVAFALSRRGRPAEAEEPAVAGD